MVRASLFPFFVVIVHPFKEVFFLCAVVGPITIPDNYTTGGNLIRVSDPDSKGTGSKISAASKLITLFLLGTSILLGF